MEREGQEFQLSSVDQALMDELSNRVRECYEEMSKIASRAVEDREGVSREFWAGAVTAGEKTDGPLHDEEVCWPAGAHREVCYKKNGGTIFLRRRS
ncbi:hypothetical protein [Paludifilum halophilum]|nr:hypothetical protein [Paludifilum halophilum]